MITHHDGLYDSSGNDQMVFTTHLVISSNTSRSEWMR